MEKITMQDIADALGISRVTVSKAFNNQAGVSEAMRELIFEKARELGYTKVPCIRTNAESPPGTSQPYRFSDRVATGFRGFLDQHYPPHGAGTLRL